MNPEPKATVTIEIYLLPDCDNCAHAHQVAAEIRHNYPQVQVRLIDLSTTTAAIPEAVFAVPTYLLNGRVWSLGNPSPAQVHAALAIEQAG